MPVRAIRVVFVALIAGAHGGTPSLWFVERRVCQFDDISSGANLALMPLTGLGIHWLLLPPFWPQFQIVYSDQWCFSSRYCLLVTTFTGVLLWRWICQRHPP